MERIENECVDCGLPCLGDTCPYRNVRRLYCDRCDSEAEMLYKVEDEELCEACLLENFEVVK